MSELRLKSNRFRAEREQDWRRLETLLRRAERQGAARLARDELLEIPVLYRQALSSLSVARAISLDQALVDYLESLCTRAYFFVYGTRPRPLERLARFLWRDWPAAVRGLWRETAVGGAITVLGTLVAFLLVTGDPDWFASFVDPGLAAGRVPEAPTQFLRGTLYQRAAVSDGLGVMAAFLFTHNAQIALFAFALGFALCVPTAALLAVNGGVLGAFLAVFAGHGLLVPALGWLLIHGVTELFAVVLAGAAGLSVGWAVAFPGRRTRLDAAMDAGRSGGLVMAGVVVMLFVAGLLEGFARQLVQSDAARFAIAGGTALAWGLYFYLPRKVRA